MRMDLTQALGLGEREVVAFVGGGGKTTAMYRLCREAAARGRGAVATGSARFTLPPGLGAPLLVDADEARLLASVRERFAAGELWLVASTGRASGERLLPLSYEAIASLAGLAPLVAVEACGSALRPFKAPAEHEPVVPPAATVVVAVVGADVFGRRLDAAAVHRPERVAALTGVELGATVTPALVAQVLAHAEGGRKDVPPGARFAVLINKASPDRLAAAREAAERLRAAGVERVVLAQAREKEPVVDVLGG